MSAKSRHAVHSTIVTVVVIFIVLVGYAYYRYASASDQALQLDEATVNAIEQRSTADSPETDDSSSDTTEDTSTPAPETTY